MEFYADDLARIHAEGFGDYAALLAPAIVAWLTAGAPSVRAVLDVGCGAGVTSRALVGPRGPANRRSCVGGGYRTGW